jgi:dienelactone hydrolase
MNRVRLTLLTLLLITGCIPPGESTTATPEPADEGISLTEARRDFKTKLVRRLREGEPVPAPPKQLFRTVRYESPAGRLAAYLSQSPKDGKKRPAIVWIFGGFGNGIGEEAWREGPPKNDQSASAFRKAGIIMMYPSLRGGNDNPGFQEGFFGEVDDVLAATEALAKQDTIDPKRIYLGGHSTGGTLALLVAASTDRFRAVFSFGPADDVANYGTDRLPFDTSNRREFELRAPVRWLHSIRCPVFVFEGEKGNLRSLQALASTSTNPLVHCYPIKGADHFSILAPLNRLLAGKVLRDDGPTTNITFTEEEVNKAVAR